MSDRPPKNHNRRWYDQIGNMTLAILVSQNFPREIQGLIAKNLNDAIDDCRKRKKHDQRQAISFGPHHQVLGLYKSGYRQRWYDPEPNLHRALSFMSSVPEPFLAEFAERILQVEQYMVRQREQFTGYPGHPPYEWGFDRIENRVQELLERSEIRMSETAGGFRLMNEQPSPLRKNRQPRFRRPSA